MSDIIEFKSKEALVTEQSITDIKGILNEVLDQADSVKELLVFIVDKDDHYLLFNTSTLNLPDKSFLTKLLDNDIHNELNQADETQLEFEPDL